jgi:hypothetical protein
MLNSDPIFWTMLNGIKELAARQDSESETLRAENAALQARVAKLEAMVEKLASVESPRRTSKLARR